MGEKDLSSRLLALSPERPIAPGAARALVRGALLAAPSGAAGGVPPRSALRGTSLRSASRDLRSVCAIGAFDGVHEGHRALLARARAEAEARGDELVVVTFSPDPSRVLTPVDPQPQLLSCEDRLRALAIAPGVDRLVTIPFTPELAALPYERFVREELGSRMALDCVVVGEDFCLGAGGAGTVGALRELGRVDGFSVIGVALADAGGAPVTATRVRDLLGSGSIEDAAELLGRCHFVSGRVVHGRGEGTGFGFPTANVEVREGLCLPAEGVYAGYVVASGTAWPAAINVGRPRSFSPGEEGEAFLEATLLGFSGDLYGAEVSVVFVRWLRAPRTFSSVSELERVVLGNVSWVREALGEDGIDLGREVVA
ncbi:MAG TPA: adenylyltransferase/cytidyltransferase family protein [Candidatus Olsenella pullistercoris]|uniref:Adenylyltransferase/cytidyltransferase family protein n=1 Tax=Candidatus Olsenella pullistercoris TaxID=2838712 RepID=A0A9D2EZI4_9ACTN|nr:adenylyltransferase/cytidyltransferase family protein [Candidatus Olsenella pullistercoris]